MWAYNHTDAILHYGVQGMKWGRRRYQNRDGSLTSAGRKRYKKSDENKVTKESIKKMSDDELRRKLNRIQMEQQYAKLSGADINRGKQYVDKIVKAGTTVAAVTSTALTLYNNADKIKNIVRKTAPK